MLFATAFPAEYAEAASAPDWVDRSGLSQAYPQGAFLTGFAATTGKEEALESYVIIPDGADQVVRTRGLARKKKLRVAEQTLSLTTMKRPR